MTQNDYFSPQILSYVMLNFAKAHLHPMWKLCSGTFKDEIESPLRLPSLQFTDSPLEIKLSPIIRGVFKT